MDSLAIPFTESKNREVPGVCPCPRDAHSAPPRYNHRLARGITGFPALENRPAQGNF